MKNLFLFLLLLCPFLSNGQNVTGTGSQTLVIAPATGFVGTPYVIRVRRDTVAYPLTTNGFNLFAGKVATGTFSFTVVSNGCVVNAGTIPPLNAPTCAQAVPNWLTGLQYRHNGTVLTVQTAGDVSQMAFDTSPPSSFTTTNPDGVLIQSGTFYGHANVSNGNYSAQWQINKSPTDFNLTLKNSGGATYSKLFTAINTGSSFVSLIGTTSPGSSTACAYTEGQLIVNWYGEAIYAHYYNSVLYAAYQNGTTGFKNRSWLTSTSQFTAQQVLCFADSDPHTTTTPPTGTTTTPPPSSTTVNGITYDSEGFIVYTDQGWTGADEKQIENGDLILKFKRSVGACPTFVALKAENNGQNNLIDDNQSGIPGTNPLQFTSDKGRQWQYSLYSHPNPGPYTVNGVTEVVTGPGGDPGTGANPVQGGSTYPHLQASPVLKSGVIQTSDRGPVFCATIRPILWNFYYAPGWIPMDIEWWIQNKVVKYKVRSTVEDRPAGYQDGRKFQAIFQELLCLYNYGGLTTHVTTVNGQEQDLRQGIATGDQGQEYYSDNCVAGVYSPDRSRGITYYTPQNAIFKSWQIGGESSYLNAEPHRNLDIVGTHMIDRGYILVGSQTESMATIASLEPVDQTFDFDFTSTNNHWWNEDARVMRHSSGKLIFYVSDVKVDGGNHNYGKFLSPVRAWQASQFANIEFTATVSQPITLSIKWAKPGRNGAREYRKTITINGNGTEQVYQFNLSGEANWNGTISYVGLEAIDGQSYGNATMIMKRARKF